VASAISDQQPEVDIGFALPKLLGERDEVRA